MVQAIYDAVSVAEALLTFRGQINGAPFRNDRWHSGRGLPLRYILNGSARGLASTHRNEERNESVTGRGHSDGDVRGGDAGPNLSEWALKGDRLLFLVSLILPDKKVTPGFGTITLNLDDGRSLSGILKADGKDAVVLFTSDGKEHSLRPAAIESRSQAKSLMPSMASILSPDELRDVIEHIDDLRRKAPR